MLRQLFNHTLKQDLERLIKKMTGEIYPDNQTVNRYKGYYLLKNGHYCNDIDLALKLRGDIDGENVIYADADFLRCRNTHRTNTIGKLIAKYNDNLPPKYLAQRAQVTDAHLDAVLNDTEQEQDYGGSNYHCHSPF